MPPTPFMPPRDDLPESFQLDGGPWIEFGPITPASKSLIQGAMARLSPETSRRRFFTVRHRLSDAELARFTELDGYDRHAIGALARHADGRVEGVGVARFARVPGADDAAEVAVLVIDAYQHRGVGKRLLAAIARSAQTRGIERLCGIVLEDNDPMLRLLEKHAPRLARTRSGDCFDVEVHLQPA